MINWRFSSSSKRFLQKGNHHFRVFYKGPDGFLPEFTCLFWFLSKPSMYGFHTRNQLENQNLQVSLHSSDQLERNHLIPWGKPSSDGYLPGEILPFLTVYCNCQLKLSFAILLLFQLRGWGWFGLPYADLWFIWLSRPKVGWGYLVNNSYANWWYLIEINK